MMYSKTIMHVLSSSGKLFPIYHQIISPIEFCFHTDGLQSINDGSYIFSKRYLVFISSGDKAVLPSAQVCIDRAAA